MNNNTYIPQTKYLESVIRSIWQVKGLRPYQNEIIIPKGVVEIIFDLSESIPVQSNIHNKQGLLPKCFIKGFNTVPIQLHLPEMQFFFGVQFHPVAIKHFFGVPACEFTNLVIDLALLNPLFHSLWQQLAEAETFGQRVRIICEWLEGKIFHTYPQELLLNSFMENNSHRAVTIKEFAKAACYSTRHLSRKIHEITGMNTEQALLYKKYLHSVHLIHNTNLALTDIAYHCNFSDQSHFIKTFKTFAHITPKEYRKSKSYVQGHIFQNVR